MTRDDIIRMAKEAGFDALLPSEEILGRGRIYTGSDDEISDELERFAALVAAAERETCAKLCEKLIIDCCYDGEVKDVAEFLADEIRERVESEVEDMQWMEENELKQGERNDSSQRD